MRKVELRRHSLRGPTGDLCRAGVRLARKAAARQGVDHVAFHSSPKARAVQTAEAFGGSRIIRDPRLGLLPPAEIIPHQGRVDTLMSRQGISVLEAYFSLPETRQVLRGKAEEVLQAVREIARGLADGERALAVSHGGTVEPAVALARGGPFTLEAAGGEFRECEGALFGLEGDEVVTVEEIRL
jgi:broad specificity phosphatase PhoE